MKYDEFANKYEELLKDDLVRKYSRIFYRSKNKRIQLKQFKKLCKLWGYTFEINGKLIENIKKHELL